ncbi:MAG: polyprenyl diphosphate synthase, partial [Pseudomonadota bacterium]
VEACGELGIEALTLYAFSTENWRRPAAEVGGLMNLFRAYFEREVETLAARGVRVRFIGDRARFAPDIRAMMEATESRTAANDALTLAVAMNYGARAEIAAAARRLAAEVSAGDRALDAVDEAALTGALDTEGMPELDLMIRTSGEQRLSNFLLWQAAYAELVFAPETWPDFRRAALHRALQTYQARDRRFGAVAPGMAGRP